MRIQLVKIVSLLLLVLSIVLLLWRVSYLSNEIKDREATLAEVKEKLVLELVNSKQQLEATELVANKARIRANTLQNRLVKLERSNEQVKCDMPSFMRDAFNGVRE